MAWSLIASTRAADSVTLNTTGANLLVVAFLGYAASLASWDSRSGNTWVKLTERVAGGARMTIAYCLNPTNTGTGHTLTDPNAGGQNADLHFYAFSAPGPTSFASSSASDDGSFQGTNTKNAGYVGSLSVTPPSNDSLIFCASCGLTGSGSTSGYSVGSSFTLGHQNAATTTNYGGASAYLNQATAAAVDPTISWTGSSRWVAQITVFTTSGGGGGSAVPLLLSQMQRMN